MVVGGGVAAVVGEGVAASRAKQPRSRMTRCQSTPSRTRITAAASPTTLGFAAEPHEVGAPRRSRAKPPSIAKAAGGGGAAVAVAAVTGRDAISEASFPGDEIAINEPTTPEPSLRHAVEDLDRPPAPFADERGPFDQPAPPFERSAAPAPAARAPEGEPPRRRSTIREPAPIGASTSPPPPATIPPPTPVISSTASEDAGTPKRGWWAKRLLGDK